MSRTREIEVYIHEEASSEKTGYWCNAEKVGSYQLKAKLIIELPERKVTISESKIRDCYDSFRILDNQNERTLVYSFIEHMKNELFKDS